MNISDRDVYEYMLNFAEDKTIINMLSVNKHFNDEKFFEKVMKRRYPLLIEFRKEKETWKHLFIRMVHILALLNEKYGIPYIPTKGCNPEKLLKTKYNIYNDALMCAAVGNHISIAKYLVENKDVTDIYNPFSWAARAGGVQVMEYLYDISKNFPGEGLNSRVNLGSAVLSAIEGEHLSVIQFLQQKGYIIRPRDVEYTELHHKDKGKKTEMLNYMKQFV